MFPAPGKGWILTPESSALSYTAIWLLALLSLVSSLLTRELRPGSVAIECAASGPVDAVFVTADCVDPDYVNVTIDSETDEEYPIPHRRVSGHFEGTTDDFNIYLPSKTVWKGRFFQLVYPTQNSSATDFAIGFGADSGGYTVQAASFGYRGNAAVAKLSRQIARDHYEDASRDIYGYIYGGSGGSLQTVGAMESTAGIWDGAVVMIQAVPFSNPNNWAIRGLSSLVLAGKKTDVIHAVSPGGHGYLLPPAAFSPMEQAVFKESTTLGVPWRAWEDFEGTGQNRTLLWDVLRTLVIPEVKRVDPTYSDDFWSQPGYLGTEQSDLGDFFRNALVSFNTTVIGVEKGEDDAAVSITLSTIPEALTDPLGLEFFIGSQDHHMYGSSFFGFLDIATRTVTFPPDSNATVTSTISENITLQVNNRWWLAVHTLHRHQIPPPSFDMYGYDFLRNANGEPLYPQREILIGPIISQSASGGAVHSGNITGKVIIMDNLLDADAFPWHADWYKHRVARSLGNAFEDNFRLYFSDNADHALTFPGGPI